MLLGHERRRILQRYKPRYHNRSGRRQILRHLRLSWVTVKTGLAPMPARSDWKMIASIAMLAGIGFTVSLFIANLSFGGGSETGNTLLNNAKLGIVIGSLIAGAGGFLLLHHFLPTTAQDAGE